MSNWSSSDFPWWLIWPALAIGGGWWRRATHMARRNSARRVDRRSQQNDVLAGQKARVTDVTALMTDHDRVNSCWLEYELDVGKLIDFPMMSDVRESLTVAFLKAKRDADGLRPTSAADVTTDARLVEYRNAVRAYELAFDVAEREAKRLKDQNFSVVERQRLTTARKLLTIAVDEAATSAERQLAYARARKELDGLLVLPDIAIAALERQVAPMLAADLRSPGVDDADLSGRPHNAPAG